MTQSLEQNFGTTEKEIMENNKQIKRALLGFFGVEREIPKMEAACLLVRKRLASNTPQAKLILDLIVGRTIHYGKRDSIFDFGESESGDAYRISSRLWFL